jgi:hypothetical protein
VSSTSHAGYRIPGLPTGGGGMLSNWAKSKVEVVVKDAIPKEAIVGRVK